MRRLALALALLILLPALAGAQAYRWVDEKGRVHYTQTPPPKGDYGTVAPPPPSPGGSPHLDALSKVAREGEKRQAKEEVQAAKVDDERQKRCERAKRHNAHIEVNRVYYTTGENGQRQYMSPEQIDQGRIEARQAMEQACN